jgi:hypothetical protein
MPTDIWYGADCEVRIGRRANAATPPTIWQAIDFISLTVNPAQEWRDRPKIGNPATRNNVLDPMKPRPGFLRIAGSLVIDADSRYLPLWLRYGVGAPATAANSSLYDHVFQSGGKTEQYFDLAVKVGAADVRVYQGLAVGQISTQFAGENTQDFNINIDLAGLSKTKKGDLTDFPAGTLNAAPAEAPILRGLFKVDNVAADQMLSASFTWGRALQEGVFLSPTPTVSSQRPNGGAHSGSATFRAMGAAFDQMEEGATVFAALIDMVGVVSGHHILFEHPQALLQPSPLPITGPGMIERTLNWAPHQSPSAPAARITVTNNVASYATA